MSGFSAPQAKTFGNDQIWQDVTADRIGWETVYHNNTKQSIAVLSQLNGGQFQVSADNITWVTLSNPRNFGESAIVPPGSYYRFSGGGVGLWAEMRVPA
ncbi:hypothetical protein [Pseudophaeobacter sp. TrK17]|uniref:hypothetical protein n=1 Tax=Pseudophaeobacter sp. TrK17 TaxID=2815167 RepID=UPI0035CF0701